MGLPLVWADILGVGGLTKVRYMAELVNNTVGETTYSLVRNREDAEDLPVEVSVTGTTPALVDSGWKDYSPPTKIAPIVLDGRLRVTAGTGTVYRATLEIAALG